MFLEKLLNQKKLFLLMFTASFAVFLLHTAYTKTAIFADGRFYYMTTRSIVKDSDIKFANEFDYFGMLPVYTNNNYVWNKYPPGASFLWIPAFFLAEGFTQSLSLLGVSVDLTGFGIIYQTSVATTSIFVGIFGLYLVYTFLRSYSSKIVSQLATFTLFAATNLLFYIAVEPIGPHAASFFVSSLFVYYFIKHQEDKYYYLVLGLVGGIAGLVRTQDLLILLLPIINIFINNKDNLTIFVKGQMSIVTGFVIGFLPQIYFWKKIFNTLWYSPYLEEGFNLLKPQMLKVLFNSQNGLITITPTIALSVGGLLLFKRKNKLLTVYTVIYFILQLYLVSSWSSFFQGGSFGIRMMLTTYPFLSFGLAALVARTRKILGTNRINSLIIFFISLNNILILRYLLSF